MIVYDKWIKCSKGIDRIYFQGAQIHPGRDMFKTDTSNVCAYHPDNTLIFEYIMRMGFWSNTEDEIKNWEIELKKEIAQYLKSIGIRNTIIIVEAISRQKMKTDAYEVQIYWKSKELPDIEFILGIKNKLIEMSQYT